MKVSWHGNRKHISARWHTKGLPVLHVAFLRERIQRGFKCYHDLTHKISQLWLTRLLDSSSFMRPRSSCYSVFLLVTWSTASTFLLHTKSTFLLANVNLQDSTKRLRRLVRISWFLFQPPAVPSSVITFHLPVNSGEALIGKQWVPIYLSSHLISDGKLHRLLLRRPKLLLPHTHTHTYAVY